MMSLADIIDARSVVSNLRMQNKKQLLLELANLAAKFAHIDAMKLYEILLTREKAGSTGFGQGVAIPHGKIAGLERPYGLFVRLANPVDYEAPDNQPVDLVFLLLSADNKRADHLKALARVSRLLRDPIVIAKLRGTSTAEGLYAILTEPAIASAA